MIDTQKFALKLKETWKWEGLEPPEDSLGELTELEMGLQNFCFEWNHKVLLEIGDYCADIFLDPDIIMILDELPKAISMLMGSQKVQLDFPESYMYIEFVPVDSKISCDLQKYGYFRQQEHFEFEKTQVVGSLTRFLLEILEQAVAGGYITPEDKDEFLLPISQQVMS